MPTTAFFLVPCAPPPDRSDWQSLDRSARIARMRQENDQLGREIAGRLTGFEVEYLAGLGGWTARAGEPHEREELIERLSGLPVDVADDDMFYTQ